MSKHIVILGAGYGGLLSALTVRKHYTKEEAKVTVVNQYPTHQIITELHRLAAGQRVRTGSCDAACKAFQRKRHRS